MASSFNDNRHWPSMFRSKHAAEPWQAQPDISGSPPPFLSGGGNATSAAASGLKHPSSGFAGTLPPCRSSELCCACMILLQPYLRAGSSK